MKRIIFALALACGVGVSNAETSINWSAGGMDGIGNGASGNTAASIAYLINAADLTQANIYAGLYGGKTLATVLGDSYVASIGLTEGAFSLTNVAVDKYAFGTDQTLFMVLYDSTLIDGNGNSGAVYFSEALTKPIIDSGATAYAFTADSSWGSGIAADFSGFDASVGGWFATTIPEPTSGMLVLLGLAGLALRRRRSLRS